MLGSSKPTTPLHAVLPLRDIVVFPHMIVPLFVGRDKSVRALEHVMHENKQILLLTQKSPSDDDPGPDELYEVGTIGTILQLLKLPDGTVKVLVEGGERVKVEKFVEDKDYLEAEIAEIKDTTEINDELEALARAV